MQLEQSRVVLKETSEAAVTMITQSIEQDTAIHSILSMATRPASEAVELFPVFHVEKGFVKGHVLFTGGST